VPRRAALSRTVGGQFPRDFDPERWGIPASMTQGMDPIASWNLVTAVDAFLSGGLSPAPVHPRPVAARARARTTDHHAQTRHRHAREHS